MEQSIVYQNCLDYIKNELDMSQTILVGSPTTLSNLGKTGDSWKYFVSSHVAFDDLESHLSDTQNSLKIVVGLGGGTAIDKAKYIAKKMDLKCIAIPSMLSTNVFATDKIAYIDSNGVKSTIDGVLPEIIVYDQKLIESSHKYSIYGLADALSSLIALKDWDIADANGVEPIGDPAGITQQCYYDSTRMLVKAKNIIKKGEFNDADIFEILIDAGYVTNNYGSGRPESGSEHIIAKGVEKRIPIPHAVAVCFGILISSQFHKCFDEAVDLIKGIGIFPEIEQIRYQVLKDALIELKPRPDRYTIIDTLPEDALTPTAVDQLLRRMYKAFDINEGAVIFDLDGVLWDSVAEIQEVYRKSLDIPEATLKEMMGKQFTHLAEALNISPSVLASIQIKEIAYLMDKPGKIYEGVVEVLDALKASGRELFIVSNCQKGYINTFLENYGLSTYFTDWRYDDHCSKYPKVTNILDLKHKYHLKRPVYVGDTQGDYISAFDACTDFVAVDYGFGEIVGEFMIGRIDDIKKLLDVLEKRV